MDGYNTNKLGLLLDQPSTETRHEPPSTSARSFNAPPPPHPKCAITGNVAKYKDPVTGLYYSDAKSFKEVRANKPKQQPNPLIVVGSSKPKAGLLKLKIKPPRLVVKE